MSGARVLVFYLVVPVYQWVVSRLSMYRGLLIDCTSCWLLSHLGLLRLERSGVRVSVFYLVLPVYQRGEWLVECSLPVFVCVDAFCSWDFRLH